MVGNDNAVDSRQESGSGNAPRLSDDRLYRALASTQRRRLLCFLLETGETTVDELATVLTGWTAAEQGTMGTTEDREQLHMALRHIHLPLLADVGLVAYDRQHGTVDIEPLVPAVSELIRESVDREQSSPA
jgi:DNA-binding transcriptional ArsR family regulator